MHPASVDLKNLVLVEWEDSTQPISAWENIENIDTASYPDDICISVGFLIFEGADYMLLAPNISDFDGGPEAQVSGVHRIPISCIRGVSILKKEIETPRPNL